MATYAQEKRNRQSILRQVKQAHRSMDSQNERLRRLLESKRRAKTMLDAEDVQDILRYTTATTNLWNSYLSRLGQLATYIGTR